MQARLMGETFSVGCESWATLHVGAPHQQAGPLQRRHRRRRAVGELNGDHLRVRRRSRQHVDAAADAADGTALRANLGDQRNLLRAREESYSSARWGIAASFW